MLTSPRERRASLPLLEIIALALLCFSVVYPTSAIWVIGLILIWCSSSWMLRDKVIGSLYVLPAVAFFIFANAHWPSFLTNDVVSNVTLVGLFLLVPMGTIVYLASRLRTLSRGI